MSQQSTAVPEPAPVGADALLSPEGRTSIADSVVAKIAGIAAREVAGIHAMGAGAARAVGALKERLPGGAGGPSPTQGVRVEVGEREAAVDLDLVVEYGVSIPDVANSVRRNVIDRLQRMTGLQVTEVNIAVDDIYLGDDDEAEEPPPPPPRVQ